MSSGTAASRLLALLLVLGAGVLPRQVLAQSDVRLADRVVKVCEGAVCYLRCSGNQTLSGNLTVTGAVTAAGTVTGGNVQAGSEVWGTVWRRTSGSNQFINLHNTSGININAQESGHVTVSSGDFAVSFQTGTAGSGTGFTAVGAGLVQHKLHKITVTNAALNAAATSDEIMWTLPAKTRVQRVIGEVTQTFSGGGITDMDVTCGTTAGGNQYLLTFDVDTATGVYGDAAAEIGAALLSATVADVPNWSGTTDLQCRFTCVGANCSAATQGSLTIYIEHVVYP